MRFIITVLLIAFTFSEANAQATTQDQTKPTTNLKLGVIGGFGFSNVTGSDVSGNGVRLGIHLGGYAQFPIENKFGFRPELHVISIKGTSSGGFKTYYFDLPLLGTYDLDDSFTLIAGFQPSILINATVDDGRGNINKDIRTIDVGFVLGAWYQIDDTWGIGARITPGILRVGADGNENTHNFNFQLSVGYRFM